MSAHSRASGRQRAAPSAPGSNAHATRAIAPPPPHLVGLTRQGLALFAVGDFHKAEQAFRVVAEVAPGEPLAWNNLALALVSLQQPSEAAAALRRSLALDPGQLSAWIRLAGIGLSLGDAAMAEEACATALALDPANAEAWQIRAFASVLAEDFAASAQAFSQAIDLAGESAALCLNLGAALMRCGRLEAAAAALTRARALDPTSTAADDFGRICALCLAATAGDLAGLAMGVGADEARRLKTAFLLLTGADRPAAAALAAEAWAVAAPDDIEAIHLRDAALARPVDRQPAELVAQHFDGIAEDFDDRLVRRLGYAGPAQLLDLIAGEIEPAGSLDILDLGCGTGLCAPLLRPYARRLAGVDLAAAMLAKAGALGLYDSLECADLLSALAQDAACWDMLVAADTFPYLGDLEPVFAGAAASLRTDGWFAFSTETAEGEGFVLQINGRYAQGARYIERLAAGRFAVVRHARAPLRREAGRAVMGEFFLLRRLA